MANPEAPRSLLADTVTRAVTRRDVLTGVAGVAGVAAVPALLAACGPAGATTAPGSAAPGTGAPATAAPGSAAAGTVKLGDYHTDTQAEKDGMIEVNKAFTAKTGIAVQSNIVKHSDFQDNITLYLGGTPDDAFTWFSGYRMQFFASQGLATAIDDVFAKVAANYTAGFKAASTGADGKIYLIPSSYYPWAVFYRKSVFAEKGYKVPTTWDELKALCTKMKADGLIPFAFADVEGWPAMGTFDILNLRQNGYDFHISLMGGKTKWTDPKVTDVFSKWKEILPFHQDAATGRKWVDAAASLIQKKAGMYLLGLFVANEFKDPADLADLDFFAYPSFGNSFDAEKALDAPIDGYMISSKSPSLAKDLDAAKAYVEFWGQGSTQDQFFAKVPGAIPTASNADQTKFSVLQKKAAQICSDAQKIAQFLDRDTRPDFAGKNGMQQFLLSFLGDPNQDLAALQGKIQAYWDQLPPV